MRRSARALLPLLAALAAMTAGPARAQRVPVVVTPGSEQIYRIAVQRFADVGPVANAEGIDDFRGGGGGHHGGGIGPRRLAAFRPPRSGPA